MFFAASIASALTHLHDLGVVYRDLKPENILLDNEGFVRITDFGLSKDVGFDEKTQTFCGTPEYLAPEVLSGHGHGKEVDWWSLGTLIYEMLVGLPPFYSQNINRMYQKIMSADLKLPDSLSDDAKSILTLLLKRDPNERLGSKGGQQVMDHPWFSSIDFEALVAKQLKPPFVPKVKNEHDLRNIDTAFTSEAAVDSVVPDSALATAEARNKEGDTSFAGFTYAEGSALSGGGA